MRVAVQASDEAAKLRDAVHAEQLEMFKERRASKTVISFFRYIHMKNFKFSATLSIQKWYRAYLPLLRARIMIRGFLHLQAFVRAYNVRSKNPEKVSAALRSIRLANSRALANPVLSLGRQTDGKSRKLLNCSLFAQITADSTDFILIFFLNISVSCAARFAERKNDFPAFESLSNVGAFDAIIAEVLRCICKASNRTLNNSHDSLFVCLYYTFSSI